MTTKFKAVIEGFYGRPWSWLTRRDYASFLASIDYQCYIYAPKSDPYLRHCWREAWPTDVYGELAKLSRCYNAAGVEWGLGLSPTELFKNYSDADKLQLSNKMEEINQLNPDVLCILFDDMPGDFPQLASRQIEIVNDILSLSTASRYIVCPTYYSFDPVLEAVFGPMPVNYLSDLGAGLPNEVDVFWTGDKVISPSISAESLVDVTTLLNRKPVLWDNVYANDGRNTAQYLPINNIAPRGGDLLGRCSGVIVNPMNQPNLAKLALQSYGSGLSDQYRSLVSFCEHEYLQGLLRRDRSLFADHGFFELSSQQTKKLMAEYATINHPLASDIVDWLAGEFQFDPSCLTG